LELDDRSRRPFRQANKLPMQIETMIVQLKREHPSWGAPKIREFPCDFPFASVCK
jgi:putative transposase